jgi:hypothetical protein
MGVALVSAVLLIQAAGTTAIVPGGSGGVGGISFVAGSSAASAESEPSVPLKTSEATTSSLAAGANGTAASSGSAASAAHATTVSESSSDSGHAMHTLIGRASTGSSGSSSSSTPACPSSITGSTAGAPSAVSVNDIPGTTSGDLQSFADEYNAIRVANCLTPMPFANIRYSDCLQQRMFWMADDPSTDPNSAWGHTGTAHRSDGLPIVGCDGDIAGGDGVSAAGVAELWWQSIDHRDSLYQPSYKGSLANVCIYFAISHGGYNVPSPNEPYSFTRAASYWAAC